MERKLLALLSFVPLHLTSCNSVKNENAIYAIMNGNENDVIELNAESVEYMINEKYSFPLLMYTNQCSYCEKAKENLSTLSKKLGIAAYQIEMYTASINYLSEVFPDYYSKEDSYPFLYIIKEGEITYKSSTSDLTDAFNLKKLLKSYTIETKIYTATDVDNYYRFKGNHEYVIFTYDSSTYELHHLYSKYLFSIAKTRANGNPILIVDKKTANRELFDAICQDLSISEDEPFDILYWWYGYNGVMGVKMLRYSTASDSEIYSFARSCL